MFDRSEEQQEQFSLKNGLTYSSRLFLEEQKFRNNSNKNIQIFFFIQIVKG
ncbi:MAG: hypothetical protein ACFE85_08525 [Candidatus Hodarchaeota archaeon]